MNFNFGSILFLLLLLLLPCFLWCTSKKKIYYFPKLLWIKKENTLYALEPWLKIFLFSLMVLALAKPFIYSTNNNQYKKGRDLILTIDASGSMAQRGFNANKRFQNKFETNIELASSFIKKRSDDNMGIVVFGTFAYTTSPLTYDLDALTYLLTMTNVGIAGESTAIGDAIMQSIRTLSFGKAKNKVIILLTDGYHNAGTVSPKAAVQKAKALGIKIYTIGIGKKSEYDTTLLETIANETGAKAYSAFSAKALNHIYEEIDSLEPSPIRSENYINQELLIVLPLALVFIILVGWTLWLERKEK